MGALPRLIAHHTTPLSLAIELGLVVGLVVLFGAIALRERRRRQTPHQGRGARMRDLD